VSFITGKKSILSISSDHILTDNDNINIIEINSSGSTVSLTLPSAANNKGRNILAKVVTHSNLVTITGTIDGETNFYMNNVKDFISVYSNGTEWKKDKFQASYETTYINRSDWTNVHIGSNTTKNVDSNVLYNLNCGIKNIYVKLLISTDGTDANSFEVIVGDNRYEGGVAQGTTSYYIDDNNFQIQTGTNGLIYTTDSGSQSAISSNDWYYKIVVKRIL
jgi:hypothetical protein